MGDQRTQGSRRSPASSPEHASQLNEQAGDPSCAPSHFCGDATLIKHAILRRNWAPTRRAHKDRGEGRFAFCSVEYHTPCPGSTQPFGLRRRVRSGSGLDPEPVVRRGPQMKAKRQTEVVLNSATMLDGNRGHVTRMLRAFSRLIRQSPVLSCVHFHFQSEFRNSDLSRFK